MGGKITEKTFDEIGMHPPWAYMSYSDWYEYLINEYILEQGEEDMEAFADLNFIPELYIIWKENRGKK